MLSSVDIRKTPQGNDFQSSGCFFYFRISNNFVCFSVAQQPNSSFGRRVVQVIRSHKIWSTHPIGLLWTSDQLFAQTSHYTSHNTFTYNSFIFLGFNSWYKYNFEWRIKNQLDATYYFIVLLIGSTCFGHYYAHHQELVTMVLITTLVVSFLVCCRL